MKPLGESAKAAARHRVWHWCRRANGFSDKPTWRVVATRLGVPIYQVVAFVHRLEEIANAADPRGSIAGFKPSEFGEALGMSAEDAARIFAALEEPDIAWVAYDHVADFFERNRDWEDDTAAERQRRKRARDTILKKLVVLARSGRIVEERRTAIEARLMLMEIDELAVVQAELRRAELSTDNRHSVTPVTASAGLSTGTVRHSVTPRDSVTVTTEQIRNTQVAAVDNFGDAAPGAEGGLAEQEVASAVDDPQAGALRWIADTGRQLVVERMDVPLPRADVLLARWCDQNLDGDAAALVAILRAEEARGYIGPRFHTNVTDAIERHVRTAAAKQDGQGRLPLGGLQAVTKRTA